MAINYEPVGWDTTKYFNPTNMNQMDNGIKAACDKSTANEAAISEVNSKLGNTDISAIGDGTVTGGLNALNSNLNKYLAFSQFRTDYLPNAFEQNKVIATFTTASNVGASGAYIPIFTCAWYDSSVVSGVWQFAITYDGVKRRYNTSATTWSDWL